MINFDSQKFLSKIEQVQAQAILLQAYVNAVDGDEPAPVPYGLQTMIEQLDELYSDLSKATNPEKIYNPLRVTSNTTAEVLVA